jgi:hypothetical protein
VLNRTGLSPRTNATRLKLPFPQNWYMRVNVRSSCKQLAPVPYRLARIRIPRRQEQRGPPPLCITSFRRYQPSPPSRVACVLPSTRYLLFSSLSATSRRVGDLGRCSGTCEAKSSVATLRRVQTREALLPPMDPIYRDWLINRAVAVAAGDGDLDAVQWNLTEYAPDSIVTDGGGCGRRRTSSRHQVAS